VSRHGTTLKRSILLVLAVFATGCPGPLGPATSPDFPDLYEGFDRTGILRPAVTLTIKHPEGRTPMDAEEVDRTTEELSALVAHGISRRGLPTVLLDPQSTQTPIAPDPEIDVLKAEYAVLSQRLLPRKRELSAPERLIVKQRNVRPSERPPDLGDGFGLGRDAVEFARRYEVDALVFVELDAVYETRDAYRSSTVWGAVLPNSAVDYAERYLPPDRFALRLSFVDAKTGDIVWAFRETRSKEPGSKTIAQILEKMLDFLPRHPSS
jgi:hypothetical protein